MMNKTSDDLYAELESLGWVFTQVAADAFTWMKWDADGEPCAPTSAKMQELFAKDCAAIIDKERREGA